VRAAQGGSDAQATRSTQATESERPEKKLVARAKVDKRAPFTGRLKDGLGGEPAEVPSAMLRHLRLLPQLPPLVRVPFGPGIWSARGARHRGTGGTSMFRPFQTLANDAEALAKALTATGFQSVTLKTNLISRSDTFGSRRFRKAGRFSGLGRGVLLWSWH